MVYSLDGQNYILRLDKGERLRSALEHFAEVTSTRSGWVSGLGGALEVTLGYYNLDTQQYEWKTFDGLREITGLQGNIALNEEGRVMFHMHGTFADRQFTVIGGHVQDLVAGATVEIFVTSAQEQWRRKTDQAVGLQTLQIK